MGQIISSYCSWCGRGHEKKNKMETIDRGRERAQTREGMVQPCEYEMMMMIGRDALKFLKQ